MSFIDSIQRMVTGENVMYLLTGAGISLCLAVASVFFGTILGVIGALGRLSSNKIARGLAGFYVEVIRGTPMLLQIMFFFLGLPLIIRMITGVPFSPNPIVIGVVAMAINSGAYSTELIRSSINAIDKGQWEAGKSLGMTKSQIMRYIILPQAFKRIIPPLVSEFIVLVKDSSLLSTIGVADLLFRAKVVGTRYANYVIPLLLATVMYLIITITISSLAKIIERRMTESD